MLIRDSDSEKRRVLDDSDVEAAYDLLEDSDNSVLTNELWCHRSEDGAKIHHFPAQKPGVNCHAPPIPHLLDCF
jgi:hypothetical protein